MNESKSQVALSCLELNDWDLRKSMLYYRNRLMEDYHAGIKSLSEVADWAMEMALEMEYQLGMHMKESEKHKCYELFRARYPEFFPPSTPAA